MGQEQDSPTKVSSAIARFLECSFVPIASYAALGLTASLNPRVPGGAERVENDKEISASTDSREDGPSSGGASTLGLPKGFGRIVRDVEGNIVSVEMDGDGAEEETPTAEEGLAENVITGVTPATECWVNSVRHDPHARDEIVQGEL
jgi:hypothetical protein